MQNLALSKKLRAQAVVEFALVLPVLVLLLAGIVDLGDGYQTSIALTNAAREGAHYGINYKDPLLICAQAQKVRPSLTFSSCSVHYAVNADGTCNTGAATRKVGGPVCVSVSYSLNTLMGGVLGFGSIPITTSATMIVFNP